MQAAGRGEQLAAQAVELAAGRLQHPQVQGDLLLPGRGQAGAGQGGQLAGTSAG